VTEQPTPTLELDLKWDGDLRFVGTSDGVRVSLDAASEAGPTPVQALAFGLAGCMAIDLVSILQRGRQPLRGLEARLSAQRTNQSPKRFTAIELHFIVEGDVPPDRVERAIRLSRETYCSVWHSLRQDLGFETSFEVRSASVPSAKSD
jgi:putative redox protein